MVGGLVAEFLNRRGMLGINKANIVDIDMKVSIAYVTIDASTPELFDSIKKNQWAIQQHVIHTLNKRKAITIEIKSSDDFF